MSKRSKSRDTSAQTGAEQRKTLSMMMDELEKMRTPVDELIGMQQNFSNDQIVKFSDMFNQMLGGTGLELQNSPSGTSNLPSATGQPQPFMQAPQSTQDQMAAYQQQQQMAQQQQPQQPQLPPWMNTMNTGPYGRR